MPGGAARATSQALLIAGFAVKVGLVPFQVWLPRGYAAAPGPARAVMAGVAGQRRLLWPWRTLALLGAPPAWLTGLLLVLAGLTALLGIAHAAVQPGCTGDRLFQRREQRPDPGRLRGRPGRPTVRDPRLAAVGLLAGTLQIIAHTAAKSLLFTGSAAIAPGAAVGPRRRGRTIWIR